jgi:cysteine-rich repeat protein
MTSMKRVSSGTVERALTVCLLALGLVACGGKQELNFVGVASGDGGTNAVSANCGDRTVDADEECDDGDRADGDGCDGTCAVEEGWTCTGSPSDCVKCGNGAFEAGEECDDGNGDDGDGCNKECKVEGSCAGPIPIELKAAKDGLVGTITSSTNKDEPGQVDAADCSGAMVGGGADRVFELDLADPADLEVRVGSNFDAVVRLTTMPCDLETQVAGGCVDQGAVAEEELARLDNAPAGKYYITVDGKTAQQAGSFSVSVTARCPLDGLKIDRVIVTEPFRTMLLNTNQSCAVDLSRVGIYAQPEAADLPELPAVSLGPLKRRLLTSESPPPNGTTYQGNIGYETNGYAGAFYLCRGPCELPSGSNVFDAVRWNGDTGKPKNAALSGVTFDANVAALADRTQMSFFRVTRDGVAPDFTADDWVGGYFVETFEDASLLGWEPPVALFYTPKFEPVKDSVGAFALELAGANPGADPDAASWGGPKATFRDNQGMPMKVLPEYVSVRVRGSDKTLNHGFVFFGNANAETSGFGSFFRTAVTGGTLTFGNATNLATLSAAYQVETWYQVEYDFTTEAAMGNVIVSVDGKAQSTRLPMPAPIGQVSLRNVGMKTSAWFDQIIVR